MKRLLNWFRLRRLENDLDRELKYHIDRRVSDLSGSGVPEPEARRKATLELGGVTQIQEEVRDVWLTRWLRDFVYDLRFSVRSFLRSPSFTATAVLSLALGIGATTAIYSLLDQVVRRALPVRQPERLVLIDWKGDQANVGAFGSYNLMSYPICRDLHMQERFFEGVLCRAAMTISLSTGGEHRLAAAERMSGTYFSVLGVNPAVGRLLTADDDQAPGASPVVVLSHDFWKTQLASTPDVVGRRVLVNQHPMRWLELQPRDFAGLMLARFLPFGFRPACRRRLSPASAVAVCSTAARMDADPGSLETRRYVGSGSGRAATLVQGDAGGGHAPRRVPQNHNRATAEVFRVDARTYSGCPRPLRPAA
jgi:hypothetical protein